MKDMKDMILASSKNIFGKVLSPTKDKLASIKSPFEKFTMNKDSGDAAKHVPVETKDKKDSATVGKLFRYHSYLYMYLYLKADPLLEYHIRMVG